MSVLGQVRITPKLLTIVIVLNIFAGVVAATGMWGLSTLRGQMELIAEAGQRAVASARMNRDATNINRAQFVIASLSDRDEIIRVADEIAADLRSIGQFADRIRSSPAPEVKAALSRVESLLGPFRAAATNTIERARAVSAQPTPADREALSALASEGRRHFLTLRGAIREQTDLLLQRANNLKAAGDATASSAWWTLAGVLGVSVILGLVLGLWIARSGITRPLQALNGGIDRLANGDTSQVVPGSERRDEIGDLARAAEIFRNNAIRAEALRAEQEAAKAAEEATMRRRAEMSAAFVSRMQDLSRSFSESSQQVSASARDLSATAEQTTRQSQTVAASAEEASSNVQTAASGAEELAASIREINEQVARSSTIASTAASEARTTSDNIRALASAASEIGAVVELINTIAGQTNLLALNATIEAARAGEAGRGFAVVASEVKALAGQTAKATDEISRKVTEIQSATSVTVGSIERIVTTIGSIQEITTAVAGAVEEQSAATSEIAANTQQAAAGTTGVTRNISGVGEAAQLTGAASSQLLALAASMSEKSHELEQEVSEFVRSLAAA